MKFMVPARVILGKKKKTSFPLNANTFANKHHRQKHNAKMDFYDYIETLDLQPIKTPVRLHLEYYTERKPNFDRDNIIFGIHKFTADALVHFGVIEDDTFDLVLTPTFEYMGIDKEDHFPDFPHLMGRCDVRVEGVS